MLFILTLELKKAGHSIPEKYNRTPWQELQVKSSVCWEVWKVSCRLSREFGVESECQSGKADEGSNRYCKKQNLYNGKLMLFLTGEQKLIR